MIHRATSIFKKYRKKLRQKRQVVNTIRHVTTAFRDNYARGLIVDCGLNTGKMASLLLNKLEGFDLIGYEIQDTIDLNRIQVNLKKRFADRFIEVRNVGIAAQSGVLKYYEPASWGENYKGGTSTLKEKNIIYDESAQVKSAKFVEFSQELYNMRETYDFIFVKMDIEGGEYELIDSMMNNDSAKLINVIAVEWHEGKFCGRQKERMAETRKSFINYCDRNGVVLMDWV